MQLQLTIEMTGEVTTIDGVPVRLWRGLTQSGRPVDVFVHRIASMDPQAQDELSAALLEKSRPRELASIERESAAISMRHII